MKNILKKTLASMLVMTMLVVTMCSDNVCAKEQEINSSNLVKDLEQTELVEYDDKEIVYDEEAIYDFLEELDLSIINEEAIKNGLEPMTTDDMYKIFIEYIDETNESLEDGELVMLSDGTMVDNDDAFYLQGGSTYDKTYWWGKKRYKSTKDANKWVRELNKTAAAEGGVGVIAGAVLGVVPGVVGGVGCWYCWALAADVDYYNGLSNRGIVASIPWVLVGYSVAKQ